MSKAKKTTDSVATVQKRPQLKKYDAISIRLPGETQDQDGNWSFQMSFVEPSGKLVHKSCTRKIWQEITTEKLFQKFRYNFEVFIDEDDKVQHINATVKKEFLPAGFTEEDYENEYKGSEKVAETKFLEITKDPTDTLRVMRAPSSCSRPTEDEILESLSGDLNVNSGTYLLGKYRIEEIRERDNVITYYIDTEFKQ
tara:strand:+ start:2508 stop:3098 length:591 start_codon:yes stop_codon:yes gene_type:complete